MAAQAQIPMLSFCTSKSYGDHLTYYILTTYNNSHYPQYAIRDTPRDALRRRYDIRAKNMQNKPNLRNDEMNVSSFITKDYENRTLSERGKNKPNQTQLKPIQSQSKPIKANFKLFAVDVIRRKLYPVTVYPINGVKWEMSD